MNSSLQRQFLDALIQKFPKKTNAVDAISNHLSIGKDAVYRRLRGDSILSPEEMKILATEYQISIDELIFNQTDKVFFTYSSFTKPVKHFDDYLEGLIAQLDVGLQLPNAEVHYATAETPMFYYCLFPEIMCFKMYTWGKSVWGLDYLENQPFSFDLFSSYSLKLMEEIVEKFMRIKSVELWCLNVLDNSLYQIDFVLNNGNFTNKADALKVCEGFEKMTKHICKMAAFGKKFGKNGNPELSNTQIEIYHNELVFTNNTVLLKSDFTNAIYSTFDSPNFLISTDQRVIEHTKEWMGNIKNKSEYITVVSEKNRNRFFNRLTKKVEKTRLKIESYLED